MREAGNSMGVKNYNMDAMKRQLTIEGGAFTVFGGEPLLTDIKDLEELFRFGYEMYGRSTVQTNGSLITDEHIRLFKQYNVSLGVSVDGPEELNDTRWAGSVKKTRLMTKRSMENIKKLCDEGRPPGIIVTIHTKNGLPKYRKRMKEWFKELESWGIWSIRIHPLEIENAQIGENLALTQEQTVDFMLDMWEFSENELEKIEFDIFGDIIKGMSGNDSNTTCTFLACDPYTTHAVQGVDHNGHQNNCGRTAKDGVDWLKADQDGYERQLALYHTPQEFGGCQGCEYFVLCKGYCPGTGLDGDWRNRTTECQSLKIMYGIVERLMEEQGETPFTKRDDIAELEKLMIQSWERGAPLPANHAASMGIKGIDEYANEYRFKKNHKAYLGNNLQLLTRQQLYELKAAAKRAGINLLNIVSDVEERIKNAAE